MDLQQLTKKNQEFIHIATNQLIKEGKSDEEIKGLLEEILPTILEQQKNGLTARGLYGAPTEWAKGLTQAEHAKEKAPETNDNPWLMWIDSSLLILTILGLMNGIMNSFNTGTPYGLVTFLVIGFGVGAGIYFMYYFVYRHMGPDRKERPKILKAILFLFLTTLSWLVIFFLATLIPKTFNPVLSPELTILLGGVAFGIRYLLKKKFNTRNAMQPPQY